MSLIPSQANSSRYATNFEVYVSKADFKFNAAHFVAFQGFRERLHGHNYTVGVRLLGSNKISNDGYVLDFGDVKKVVKIVCKRLNERFLCPTKSDVMSIEIVDSIVEKESGSTGEKSKSVVLACEDGARFVIPHDDCAMLPIVHATVEELAIYIWGEIIDGLDCQVLRRRGIHTMEVVTAEAPGQEAAFRYDIPNKKSRFDIPSFIMSGDITIEPKPCLDRHQILKTESEPTTDIKETKVLAKRLREPDTDISSEIHNASESSLRNTNVKHRCSDESCTHSVTIFSKQLEQLAAALNKTPRKNEITADDLRSMLEKESAE